jgi:hypothetical protein
VLERLHTEEIAERVLRRIRHGAARVVR